MFLRVLILFFCLSNAYAKTLLVGSSIHGYTLNLLDNKISIVSRDMNLSLDKKICNQSIFDRFIKKITQANKRLNTEIINDENKRGFLDIKLEQKVYSVNTLSSLGKFYYNLPRDFRKLKVQDQLVCK